MTKAEQEVRENLAIVDKILKKLDLIRNELLPYYGNVTLKEAEEMLWVQYEKFNNEIHKVFENE